MSDGTIVKWLKKEGDPIVPGDVLCDIQTDKAVVSFETEEEGVLAKILVCRCALSNNNKSCLFSKLVFVILMRSLSNIKLN